MQHKEICPEYPILCNKCNLEMLRKDLVQHDLGKCV